MRYEIQIGTENEAKRFGFLLWHPIKSQLWFHMHSAQLAKVQADCLGLGQFELTIATHMHTLVHYSLTSFGPKTNNYSPMHIHWFITRLTSHTGTITYYSHILDPLLTTHLHTFVVQHSILKCIRVS